MRVLVMLLIVALAVLALGVQRPDPALALGGAAAVGAIVLILLALIWRRPGRAAGPARHVVIDGSNLIYWQDAAAPSLMPVKAAIAVMQSRGFVPGVIFDANVGYKIGDAYRGDRALARELALPQDRVLVVPKGVPADQYILEAARSLAAPVLSNDRYRDWAESFPEVAEPGRLIRGGWRDGDLWIGS